MEINLAIDIETVKGFLAVDEGEALYKYALEVSERGPCLEIGSYRGKSTVYLGSACQKNRSVLYALDHHRGSEEHQPGEEYHDPDIYNDEKAIVDSFGEFRHTIERADLVDTVIPIVAESSVVSRGWVTPLSMVFIDGGHSHEAVLGDYRAWAPRILAGGILAIHDIFPDPSKGGQAPYEIWKKAVLSGLFEEIEIINTLGFLRGIRDIQL